MRPGIATNTVTINANVSLTALTVTPSSPSTTALLLLTGLTINTTSTSVQAVLRLDDDTSTSGFTLNPNAALVFPLPAVPCTSASLYLTNAGGSVAQVTCTLTWVEVG